LLNALTGMAVKPSGTMTSLAHVGTAPEAIFVHDAAPTRFWGHVPQRLAVDVQAHAVPRKKVAPVAQQLGE
jgi:hypothetical protein